MREMEEWAKAVNDATDLPTVNQLVKLSKEHKLPKEQKGLLAAKAEMLGFEFDKETGLYGIPAKVQ